MGKKIYELQDINNSWTKLKTTDDTFMKVVIEYLSPFMKDYQFSPLYRAKLSDGRIKLYRLLPNNDILIPIGLTSYIEDVLIKTNKEYKYSKITETNNITMEELDEFIKTLNIPFSPYDYQKESVLSMINDKKLIIKSATGSGKSLVAYIVFMYLMKKDIHCVLVVPTTSLVEQMFTDFQSYGMSDIDDVLLINSDNKEHKKLTKIIKSKKIIITTWQSLRFFKVSEFKDIGCLLFDEAHLANADVLEYIIKLSENSDYKFGMTGTIPKDNTDRLKLIGSFGKIKDVITAGELIARGLATPINIEVKYLNYHQTDIIAFQSSKKSFNEEIKFIEKHNNRMLKIIDFCLDKSKTGNVLGTYTNIKHGEEITKYLAINRIKKIRDLNTVIVYKITPKALNEAYESYSVHNKKILFNLNLGSDEIDKIYKILMKNSSKEFIEKFLNNCFSLFEYRIFLVNQSTSSKVRESIRFELEKIDNKNDSLGAIIVGSWSIVSTGINYKNLHYIMYFSSLKSYTKVIQLIGRGMRLHKSKEKVTIYDMVDSFGRDNYMQRHFYQRLEYYREQEIPIFEEEINIKSDFIKNRGNLGFDFDLGF